MLHPRTNRIDYGEKLIPPEGYELDYAVGTTYSLDLEALMVLPVALFYSQNLDAKPDELRYDILDAITKAADKIRVYYQEGKLKVPRKYNYLMAYWEKGIKGITMPDYAASFHPKIWVIRYTSNDQPPCFRFLITSRNLTNARDWDVAFSTEGKTGDAVVDKSLPLVHFLKYLEKAGGSPLPERFFNDLSKTAFTLPDQFRRLNFYPIGIPDPDTGDLYANPLEEKTWDELLVISPFVQDNIINHFIRNSKKPIKLLSRKDELDTLNSDTINKVGKKNCYQFSEFIRGAEFLEELGEER